MPRRKRSSLDPELAELIPIFVDEVRDRLERLASLASRVADDDAAQAEVKRELHTVKGAARMLQVGQIAELAHATEELVLAAPPAVAAILTDVVDRLSTMVDSVAAGQAPEPDPEMLAVVMRALEQAGTSEPEGDEAASATPAEEAPPAKTRARAKAGRAKGRQAKGRKAKDERPAPEPADDLEPEPEPEPESVEEPAADAEAEPGRGASATRRAPISDVRVDAAALDTVADSATQVRILALAARTSLQRIYDLAHLAEEGVREEQPRQVLAVLGTMLRRLAVDVESGHRRLLRSAEDGLDRLLTLQLQPLRGYLLHLARYARELARSLGREVEVRIEGEDTRLDRRIARELEESLLHLVRNAVDHGIEPPGFRKKQGKAPVGTIRLTAEAEGGRVRLTISDDGAGIEPDAVVRQAARAGLIDPGTAEGLTQDEVFRLLFTPGFSTRRKVSEISGRGVGLDVVASAVTRVGGEVFLASEPGQGTTVVVEVPVARRGEEVLLVRVGRTSLAIPAAPVREVLRIETAKVRERDGRSYVQIGDRLVPFLSLGRLFAQPIPDSQLLLLGRVSGQPLAVAVDSVEGEEEIMVRPMTRSVSVEQAVDGMALLASGAPIPVLSPAILAKRQLLKVSQTTLPIETVAERVTVLLVDDSLVTREMERRLLEDAGFDVTAAADADEGLHYLGEESFDCLVTDIEMPGMDGYELTRHLRGIPRFAHLPIIVVSTRERPEDRLQGLQAGADAYLTKQALDAGELVDLVRRLSGTR